MTIIRPAISLGSRIVIFALLVLAPSYLWAQVAEIKAESKVMPDLKAGIAQQNAPSLKLDLRSYQISRRIQLEPLDESAKNAMAPGAKDGPLLVGIGRDMPSPDSDKVELSTLQWIGLNGGGQATALAVTSSGASALRLGLSVKAMAEGIEIRFFSMETPERVFGPYVAKDLLPGRKIQKGDTFWSPVIEGDTIGMEVYLPEGRSLADLSFSIPKISHLWTSVLKSAEKRLQDIGDSESCEVDIACNTTWATTGNSVVKYVWTSYPYVYMCTGTLMADQVPGTYIPYFLTANHCLSSQSNASNINTYWFFQKTTCGGANPTSVTQQTGGAILLHNGTSADHSFLQLNDTPPGGAVFAGWTTATVSPGTSIVGIHHPAGDLKKISLGTANGYAPYEGAVDGTSDHTRVTWNNGVTEGGSSGSGIWITSGGNQYLVGTLHGGQSDCSTPTLPDWYGRFDVAYSYISSWLTGSGPSAQQLQNNVAVTGISDVAGSNRYYYVAVPAGATSLTVTTTGVSGDMDLYVRYGSLPTTSTYDCRPFTTSANESCSFTNPTAGNWYIMLNGYTDYTGVSLVASYVVPSLPDLVVSSGAPTATPSTVAAGGTVQLSAWTVRNQGSAASGSFSNGFYLSTDATITSADTLLTSNSNSSLAAGGSYNWGAPTLTIPPGTSPGTYYIGILVDNTNSVAESNENNNYASVQITVISQITALTNGVPVPNISGASGSQQFYYINVPAGMPSLTVNTSGGSGDVDLYVRYGSLPSLSSYDCISYSTTTTETCSFANPAAGTWYIMLNGYTSYSGVSLVATIITPLQNGVPVTNLSGASGSQQFFYIYVPTGYSVLKVAMSGGSGDADLYVRYGSLPTTSSYDCRPYMVGNNETCTFANPPAGNYYVLIDGFTSYSGAMLIANYYNRPTSRYLSLSSGGAISSNTTGAQGGTWVGYSALTVNSGVTPYGTAVFSFTQNGITVTEAGVPASPPTYRARVFIDYRNHVLSLPGQSGSGYIDINTGIAIVNTNAIAANVVYTLRDLSGNTLAYGNGSIAANTHFAKFINQLVDVAPNFSLPSNFRTATQFGTLEISSNQPLSVLALRGTNNQRNDFLITTTPVADLTQSLSYSNIYFPQFVDGGGYSTSLILVNTSSQTEGGTLQILNNSGSPLIVHPVGGTSDYMFRYSIPAGGAYRFQTDGFPSGASAGWVRLLPDSGNPTPIGSGVFSYNPGPMLISESGIPSAVATTHARVYLDLSANHNTGLAIANVGSSAATITIRAYQTNGTTQAGTPRGPLQLTGYGHDAEFADQFITGLPAGFTGVLDISSSSPFAALTIRSLVNQRFDFLMTTFPIADVNASAPSPIVFPQVVDGGGYATQVILISSSGAAGTSLTFYDEDGTY